MKSFQLLIAALAGSLAFGALGAVSAAAVIFLLAEWLHNGIAVTSELSIEVIVELLLEDNNLVGRRAAILCSGIFDGWVGANSLGLVNEVLRLTGERGRLGCEPEAGCGAIPIPEAGGLNLGWETEVELMEEGPETFFILLILPHSGGRNPGWELRCEVGGLILIDECIATEAIAKLALSGTELLANFSETFTELAGLKLANCSFGGIESGVVEGEGVIKLAGSGEELTASSESLVA